MTLTYLSLLFIVYIFTAYWFYRDTRVKAKSLEPKLDGLDEISLIITAACWPFVILIGLAGEWFIRNVSHK